MGWGKAIAEGLARVGVSAVSKDTYIKCMVHNKKKNKDGKCKYCNGTLRIKVQKC